MKAEKTPQLNPYTITWVLFDPCVKRVYKYQERKAAKYGFSSMPRKGTTIYCRHYGTRAAAIADAENIRKAVEALRTRNNGKHSSGIGTVISDRQFSRGTFENPYLGWSSRGSELFVKIMQGQESEIVLCDGCPDAGDK